MSELGIIFAILGLTFAIEGAIRENRTKQVDDAEAGMAWLCIFIAVGIGIAGAVR